MNRVLLLVFSFISAVAFADETPSFRLGAGEQFALGQGVRDGAGKSLVPYCMAISSESSDCAIMQFFEIEGAISDSEQSINANYGAPDGRSPDYRLRVHRLPVGPELHFDRVDSDSSQEFLAQHPGQYSKPQRDFMPITIKYGIGKKGKGFIIAIPLAYVGLIMSGLVIRGSWYQEHIVKWTVYQGSIYMLGGVGAIVMADAVLEIPRMIIHSMRNKNRASNIQETLTQLWQSAMKPINPELGKKQGDTVAIWQYEFFKGWISKLPPFEEKANGT